MSDRALPLGPALGSGEPAGSSLVRLGVAAELALSGLVRREVRAGPHRVAYLARQSSGRPHALPLVMLHGFGGDGLNWVRYARHLDGRRLVIPDLPGFGDSDRLWDQTYSTDQQASWLADLLDALEIDRAHLAGNSMGGHVATRFAARYPERVTALVLHAPAGTQGAGPPWDTARMGRGHHPVLVETEAEFDELLRWTFVQPPWLIPPLRRYLARRATAHVAFTAKVFSDIMRPEAGNALVEPLLPCLAQPTLVLWGDGDRLLDVAEADVYARLMPDARVHVLRGCGHLPMAERPRLTARLTRSFLAGTEHR